MAKRFNVDSSDGKNWLKVLGYTILTAVIVAIYDYFNANIQLPTELLWLSPVINTILVALKDLFENRPTVISGEEAE